MAISNNLNVAANNVRRFEGLEVKHRNTTQTIKIQNPKDKTIT